MRDPRPICTCPAYEFPHKIGGKCDGSRAAEFYYNFVRSECESCNLNRGSYCEAAVGQEAFKNGQCYTEAIKMNPGEHLPMKIEDII